MHPISALNFAKAPFKAFYLTWFFSTRLQTIIISCNNIADHYINSDIIWWVNDLQSLWSHSVKTEVHEGSHFLVKGEGDSPGLIVFAPGRRNWHQLTQRFLEWLPVFSKCSMSHHIQNEQPPGGTKMQSGTFTARSQTLEVPSSLAVQDGFDQG